MEKTTTGAVVLDTLIPTALADALKARLAANILATTGPQTMVDMLTEAAQAYENGQAAIDTLGYTHAPALAYPAIVTEAMTASLP